MNGTLLWEKSVTESEGVSVSVDADGNFLVLADATTLGDAMSRIMVIDENGETTYPSRSKIDMPCIGESLLRNKEGNLVLLHKQFMATSLITWNMSPMETCFPARHFLLMAVEFFQQTINPFVEYRGWADSILHQQGREIMKFGAPSQISYCSNMVNNEFFCTAHKDSASYDLAMYYFSSDIAS